MLILKGALMVACLFSALAEGLAGVCLWLEEGDWFGLPLAALGVFHAIAYVILLGVAV